MQVTSGSAAIRSRTYDRRRRNCSFIAATESWGPVIASSAAHWLTEQGLLVSWLWMSPMNFATAGGATDQPIRQPVIAYVLLTPEMVIVRSARPGRSVAKQVGSASPYVSCS